MIVNRHIWVVREGHTIEEAMELLKEWPSSELRASRVLHPSWLAHQDAHHTLVFEFEFDSFASMAERWTKLGNDPRVEPFMEKWRAVCEGNSQQADIWVVLQ
jgi:hypothetical protein